MRKILLIEDEKNTRELLVRLLSGSKRCFSGEVKIQQASGWDEGSRWVDAGGVDVVLLDLSLPPLDRQETSVRYAALAKTWPATIVITGHEEDELRRRMIGFGAQDYMQKDLAVITDPNALMERIYNAWLRTRYQNGPK